MTIRPNTYVIGTTQSKGLMSIIFAYINTVVLKQNNCNYITIHCYLKIEISEAIIVHVYARKRSIPLC